MKHEPKSNARGKTQRWGKTACLIGTGNQNGEKDEDKMDSKIYIFNPSRGARRDSRTQINQMERISRIKTDATVAD
jgi:hypothetical protein